MVRPGEVGHVPEVMAAVEWQSRIGTQVSPIPEAQLLRPPPLAP